MQAESIEDFNAELKISAEILWCNLIESNTCNTHLTEVTGNFKTVDIDFFLQHKTTHLRVLRF